MAIYPLESALQDGVAGVDGLEGAFDVVLSPDGLFAYVTGRNEHSISCLAEPINRSFKLSRTIE